MSGYIEYLSYENGEYLTKAQLKLATNYVCGYLNNPDVYYRYYYDMYCYISKSFIVCRWKKNMVTNHLQKLVKQSVKMF